MSERGSTNIRPICKESRNMRLRLLTYVWLVGCAVGTLHPAQSQQFRYDPDLAHTLIDKANEASSRGDNDGAIRLAVQATQADPGQSSYFGSTAWFSFKGGYYKEGVQFGERALFLNPDDWGAHFIIAANAYRSQDIEKARFHYKAALANPNIDDIHIREAHEGLRQLSDRDFEISWSIANKGPEIIVPFVYDTPYQKTLSYSVQGGSYAIKQMGGQKVVAITPLSDAVTYTVKVRVLCRVSKKGDPIDEKISGNPQEYLTPSPRINSNDRVVTDVMSQIRGDDPTARMYGISWWLKHNVKYQLNYEEPSASETIRRGFAECREFSETATATARNAHIPCRVMWVLIVPDDPKEHTLKGHFVVEFFTPAMGWVPLEPQEPWSVGMLTSGYIRICHADPACVWGPYMGLSATPNFTETRK